MENDLYQCIYDILLSNFPEPAKLPALQRYKDKIVRLHARRMEKVMLDNNAQDKMEDRNPPSSISSKFYSDVRQEKSVKY